MQQKGFTLLELLIVLAVLGVLMLISFTSIPRFQETSDLNAASEGVVSLLSEARSRTLSSENESQFGIYFQADRAVLFSGPSYATTSTDNKEFHFPDTIELRAIILNGATTTVLFERLTGTTNQHGSLTFAGRKNTEKTRRVTVLSSGASIQSTPTSIPSADLAGYWRFDEGIGTSASDSSGNGNNGTLLNMESTDWISGLIGGALQFDGNNEYITIPNPASLDISGDITMSTWINPTVNSTDFHNSWNFFIYHRDPLKYETGFYNDGGPRFKPYNQSGTNFEVSPDILMNMGTWYNVIHIRRGSAIEIYVDGVLLDSRNDFTGDLRTGGTEVRIGGAGSSNSGFIGTMDEIAIWNRALSSEEVDQIQSMRP